jgi:hypothetical protein
MATQEEAQNSPKQCHLMGHFALFRFARCSAWLSRDAPLPQCSVQEYACNQYGMNSASIQGPMVQGKGGRPK